MDGDTKEASFLSTSVIPGGQLQDSAGNERLNKNGNTGREDCSFCRGLTST